MAKGTLRKEKRLHVPVDPDVRAALVRRAKAEERSLAKTASIILKRALAQNV